MTPNIEPATKLAAGSYERFHSEFSWDIPSHFNFGVDVVDYFAENGDGLCLVAADDSGEAERFSFSDMAAATNRLGAALQDNGIQKGDFVIILLPRIPQWQIAMVAALKIGAIPVPCIEMLTAKDIEYRVRNSGAKGVICRADQTGKFSNVEDDLMVRMSVGEADGWLEMSAAIDAAPASFTAAKIAVEEPAIMFYTSGSTGNPKGVLHSSRALYSWWVSAAYWLNLDPGDVIWCTADTGWSKAGTSILFGPWARGAAAFFYNGPFEPRERLRLLERHKVTVYCAPTTELMRVAEEVTDEFDLGALRHTVSAGEAVNPIVVERWQKATGLPIHEAYGQTEALMIVLNYPGETLRPGSMGRPSPGSVVAIVDEKGNPVGVDKEGDIALATPNPQLMLEYWKEPQRTQSCFRKGSGERWYITGDRGVCDKYGYIWYRGRLDDIISSAGYRIGPDEVENALLDHRAVAECAVVGKPDPDRGEIVKAFVRLRAEFSASKELADELQAHCKSQTAPYKYPREIEFIDSIPKTLTGKIRRSELRAHSVTK